MNPKTLPLLILVVGVAAPSGHAVDDSPLVAAARQEQQRRDKLKGTARVVTEREVAGRPVALPENSDETASTTPPDPASAAAVAPEPPAKPEKSAADLRAERRATVLRELDEQRARITELRRQLEPIERELGDVGGYGIGARRAALTQTLEDGRSQIAAAEARVGDLEEEARRLGANVTR